MTTGWMAPFTEFGRQGTVLLAQGLGFQILQTLVHQIERVIDQLGGLFRGHGSKSGWHGCKGSKPKRL